MRLLLQDLLGDLPAADFVRDHYLQRPLARAGTGGSLGPLATWEAIDRLVTDPGCDLVLVRDGRPFPGERPKDAAEARRLFAEGYSLALRNPDRVDAGLAQLGRTLSTELQGTVNLHVYATPAGHGSFGWHYDPEEVFIVQTLGTKRYLLRENTQHPSPLADDLAPHTDVTRERTPVVECTLQAGDVLYIPSGWWHQTHAETESLSVSVGLLAPTALDVLDFLRAQLARDPAWRRRLAPVGRAVPGTDAEKLHALKAQLGALGEALSERLGSDALALQFVMASVRRAMASAALRSAR